MPGAVRPRPWRVAPARALPPRSAGVRPLPRRARSRPWRLMRRVRCPRVARPARGAPGAARRDHTARSWHPARCARSWPGMVVTPSLGVAAACSPLCGLEVGPACLWRAALSSTSAARVFGPGMAPLPARGARACSRGARGALARLVVPSARSSTPSHPSTPLCIPCVVIALFISIKWKTQLIN
jgi:hypothetical protein